MAFVSYFCPSNDESFVLFSSFCVLSFLARYQHEEGLQELHHSGPAGGVQEQRSHSGQRNIQPERQASTSQHINSLQVGVAEAQHTQTAGWA